MILFVLVFIKKRIENEFVIIIVYVDDISITWTPNELTKEINCLKKEFKMKDLERTKFPLGLLIKYLNKGAFVHQDTYTMKVIKNLYGQVTFIMHSHDCEALDVDKGPFKP